MGIDGGFGRGGLIFEVERFRETAKASFHNKGEIGLRRYLALWTSHTKNTLIRQAGGMNGFVKFIGQWLGDSQSFDPKKLRELGVPVARSVQIIMWAHKAKSFRQLVDLYRQWRSLQHPSGMHTTNPFWEREVKIKPS